MNLYRTIFALLALLSGVSCQELPLNIGGDRIVASVGSKSLKLMELERVTPKGLSAEDSLAFVVRYTETWIKNSVKLHAAEQLFASSEQDIEALVEEYRNSLMVRRLNNYHINGNYKTLVVDSEIEEYYESEGRNFILNKPLVKGRILTLPKEYKEHKTILKQMSTLANKQGADFKSICEKQMLDLVEFDLSWVEYSDFLALLPIVRRGSHLEYISVRSVQQMEDNENRYFFQITDVLDIGEVEPLERVEDKIRYILNNKKQAEFLSQYEDSLLQSAIERDEIRNYVMYDL